MKNTLLYLLLVFAPLISSCSKPNSAPETVQTEASETDEPKGDSSKPEPSVIDTVTSSTAPKTPIDSIRAQVGRINSLSLEKKSFGFDCDEKGTIIYHLENGQPVKIEIDWGVVGDARRQAEKYYQNGKLIFSYEVISGAGACAGCDDTTFEKRIYVRQDKTIRQMEDKNIIDCNKCTFKPTDMEYQLLEAYKTKNFGPALCY